MFETGNDVASNIMIVIERERIDMVVLSTHGMSGWRPMVFGSIAEKVVKLVQCPLPVATFRQTSHRIHGSSCCRTCARLGVIGSELYVSMRS